MTDMTPAMRHGLNRLSQDLGRHILTPAQRQAREVRQAFTWVACPHCGADKGQLCRTPSGDRASKTHRARHGAARAEMI